MSGYDGPTTDPWAAIKQREAREHEAAQEANRPGRTQTFQSVRKLWNAILELRALVLNMTELFNRLPQNDGRQLETDSWTPPSSWTTILSTTIPRPANMNRVVVSANAFVSALASGSALGFRARLVINGETSIEFIGTVVGSAVTTSTAYPSLVREITALTAPVSVQLQLSGAGTYQYDQRATLSVTAGFSRVG